MIELGREGASQKMIFSDMGINKDVAKTWCKNYPEFADALSTAVTHSQAYWEREILANVNNKGFNSRLAEIALRGQFQEDYRETRDNKVDAKVEIKIDFNKEISDLISALKA
jgi:predicted TIM-barrel fold metal-dependent hydrolase